LLHDLFPPCLFILHGPKSSELFNGSAKHLRLHPVLEAGLPERGIIVPRLLALIEQLLVGWRDRRKLFKLSM
jgi:hypothetical protein